MRLMLLDVIALGQRETKNINQIIAKTVNYFSLMIIVLFRETNNINQIIAKPTIFP